MNKLIPIILFSFLFIACVKKTMIGKGNDFQIDSINLPKTDIMIEQHLEGITYYWAAQNKISSFAVSIIYNRDSVCYIILDDDRIKYIHGNSRKEYNRDECISNQNNLKITDTHNTIDDDYDSIKTMFEQAIDKARNNHNFGLEFILIFNTSIFRKEILRFEDNNHDMSKISQIEILKTTLPKSNLLRDLNNLFPEYHVDNIEYYDYYIAQDSLIDCNIKIKYMTLK